MTKETILKLVPKNNEITHLKIPTKNKMISQYSIYFKDDLYHLTKGLIYNQKQNHTIIENNSSYANLINKLIP